MTLGFGTTFEAAAIRQCQDFFETTSFEKPVPVFMEPLKAN